MPLWKRLTIILGGVLLVIAVAIARMEYLSKFSPEPLAQGNYAAEIYQHYLESLKASLLLACEWIGEIFGNFVDVVERNDKFIVAMSTVLIAVFTIILGGATLLLWKATKRLVVGAENTSERQLRAYVEVEIEKFDVDAVNTHLVEIVLRVHNFGKTPAYDTRTESWVALRPWPQVLGLKYVKPPSPGPDSLTIINPGRAVRATTGTSRPLTEIERTQIAAGTPIRLYVYGTTTYRDAFGRDRFTEFCFAVQTQASGILNSAITAEHNRAN